MNPEHLKRLKEEQELALAGTEEQLAHWNQFRSDYLKLHDKLRTLPAKLTHNHNVPFGPLAFMPGQLVHTNEILVLLGDNYFIERSASQAAEIVSRRLKNVDKQIKELEEQRQLLLPRADFTSHMLGLSQGSGEEREIIEPYDEEAEQVWKERHKEYLKTAAAKKKEGRERNTDLTSDAELFARLSRLELQEEERGELQCMTEDENDASLSVAIGGDTKCPSASPDDSHNSSSSLSAEEEESEEEECSPAKRIITFSHTKTQQTFSETPTSADEDPNSPCIRSPADLYSLVTATPKSILKTSSATEGRRAKAGAKARSTERNKAVSFDTEDECRDSQSVVGKNPGGWRENAGDDDDRVGKDLSAAPSAALMQAFKAAVVERRSDPGQVCFPTAAGDASCFNHAEQIVTTTHSEPVSQVISKQTDSVSINRTGDKLSPSSRPVSKFRASRMK